MRQEHHYELQCWMPADPNGRYTKHAHHRTMHIIAASVLRACEVVTARYPGAEIKGVQHRGSIDVFDIEPI